MRVFHHDHAAKGFLGVFQTSIRIIKDANAVPQLGLGFWAGEVV